ncbi:MAG: glycosyl hydrolase 2 galactose-binding domain-containing protein [Planctomycetota bacterium]|jgi:beta-galactosidase
MRIVIGRIVVPWALFSAAASAADASQPKAFVWIEAEQHDACNFPYFETNDMGKPRLLSGGKWLMKGMDQAEIKKIVPDEGIRLKYAAEVPKRGTYDVWARVGFFGARASFRWRVGGGEWSEAPKTMPTTNLMEMGFFCEASWAHLGQRDLDAGQTSLELLYPKAAGENERMLVALDCLALVEGRFVPEGPFKPGETYDDEIDRRAGEHVFRLPNPDPESRVDVELSGLWQVARYDDPNMDRDTYLPVRKLPSSDEYPLRWMGFEVPGSPWGVEPLVFGHRLIYRTQVEVPEAHRGRGFALHFSGTNWIASVFVNGQLAGTHRGVWVPWDLDVSNFIEPGRINEIAVAVKGAYYALDAKSIGEGQTLETLKNRPLSRKEWTRWVAPIYPSVKGDGDGYLYGIVNPVTLASVGSAYTDDVFVKPSVEKKRLDCEVTVRNPGSRGRTLEVVCEAVYDRDDTVEKSFGPVTVSVPAGGVQTVAVAGPWPDAKLWWPEPNPHLYRLRTTVSDDGRPIDVHEELFGFREVTVRGTGIYINGVRRNFWNWVDVHAGFIERPHQWADAWRQDRSRFMRFSHGRKITTALPTREERLEFYDRNGIPGRLCTMIDGMFISFSLGLRTRDSDGNPLLVPNEPVWENFREHMAQVAKAYRNHPSVIFYQVENELVYINGMNIYGSYLDKVEELMGEVCEAGRKHDPTRPYTVGGGGDLSGRLEINSPHYPTAAFDHYPENAYTLDHYATKIERWPWDRKKPWVVGESCFANELAYGAYVAGDGVFRGIDDARRGKAKWLRMLYGGYRWAGAAGFFPWDNLWSFDDGQKIFSDLCAVPRKQSHRLFAGKENRLAFKIMNDTLSREPVTLTWSYRAGGATIASEAVTLRIEPGFGKECHVVVPAPEADERIDGLLALKVSQDGAEDYVDQRVVPVLPSAESLSVNVPVYLYDRKGGVAAFLTGAGVDFQKIESLDTARGRSGLLIVGNDTLTPEEAHGTALLAFAAGGGRVICLEQDVPPAGSALPAPIKPTTRFGGYAHPQALGTPIFADLAREDLIDWAGDSPTYKNAYQKPSQGGRSLAECGPSLDLSPLVEVPCGDGVILLCQLRVGAKLGSDAAADILLRNFIRVYADYRPATGRVAVFSPNHAPLAEKARQTGVLVEPADRIKEALNAQKHRVALVHASAENLESLVALRDEAEAFQKAGGWIVLAGLKPPGVEAFNELLGTRHVLRPFRVERVTLENPHYPLAATLGNRDVALLSPDPLLHGRYWVSSNTYSYVIDGQNFAPFTQPPGGPEDPFEYQPTRDDHDPFNFVNGMLSSDFWRYIQQLWLPEQGPLRLVFRLRRPDVLETIKIWNNEAYWTIQDLDVVLDGGETSPIRTVLPDSSDLTVVKLPEPVEVRKTITLVIRSWRQRPLKRTDVRLVGIDNVEFLRPAPPEGAVFLDNVGGLVAFPRGQGGVLLCQIKWLDEEPRPENAAKKLRILGVLLGNMGAGSRSASVVAVPGLNVRFTPVSLQERCNAYLDDKSGRAGWFGQKGQNLRILPRGRHDFAHVTYHVVDYPTAPTPDCVILGGSRAPASVRDKAGRIEGIPVGRTADLLYFLHAAHVARPITDDERRRMLDRRRPFAAPTVARYVLHYADGQSAEIPVVLERHVDHWAQEEPKPLEGALVGWSRPLEALEGERAVLYSMQAANPRPQVAIDSIDLIRATDRATPAVVAVTLGEILSK